MNMSAANAERKIIKKVRKRLPYDRFHHHTAVLHCWERQPSEPLCPMPTNNKIIAKKYVCWHFQEKHAEKSEKNSVC